MKDSMDCAFSEFKENEATIEFVVKLRLDLIKLKLVGFDVRRSI